MCFDHPETPSEASGLVNLSLERFNELIGSENIILDSSKFSDGLPEMVDDLKEWHPSISRVEVDCDTPSLLPNLDDYPMFWEQYQPYLNSLQYNQSVTTSENFEVFKKCSQIVVDVKVYFRLLRKYTKINDYHVNFKYLQQLLSQRMIAWNNENAPYFDEVSVKPNQLPFATTNQGYVYPYLNLIPMVLDS
jgi:hypothetical protein